MVLDTSALVAILLDEPEAAPMLRAIAKDETRLVGTPTLVETAAVMNARKGPGGEVALDTPGRNSKGWLRAATWLAASSRLRGPSRRIPSGAADR